MVSARQLMSYAPYAGGLASVAYRNPFNGRTRQNMPRSYTRTLTKTTRRPRQMKSQIKQIITNEKPAKHNTWYAATQILHNSIYTISPSQNIVQGDTNADRDGDQVQMCSLKLKGQFFSDTSGAGYTYRLLVGYSGEEENVFVTWNNGALSEAELFLPITGNGHRTNAIVNPKAFTCLYDQIIDINSLLDGISDVASYEITVPLGDTKFPYQSTGSQYGKNRNLYVVLIGCKIGGTLGVTDAGDIQMSGDLIFK